MSSKNLIIIIDIKYMLLQNGGHCMAWKYACIYVTQKYFKIIWYSSSKIWLLTSIKYVVDIEATTLDVG